MSSLHRACAATIRIEYNGRWVKVDRSSPLTLPGVCMTTGFLNEGRRDEGPAARQTSRVLNLLLFCCSAIALLLAMDGGGFVSAGALKAIFWALVAGLATMAIIFLWRAARALRMMHR